MKHETETKPSNSGLPQHERTAYVGMERFLLWMLDDYRVLKTLCVYSVGY